MPSSEVMARSFLLLSSVLSLAQQQNPTDLDFALALSSAFMSITDYASTVTPAPAGRKKKAENSFGLSNAAYKVTVAIPCSGLQVTPVLSAAVNSL